MKVEGMKLERVECVTLLGLKIANDLSWQTHTEYIVKRAHQRLLCLNMLKHAKVSPKDVVQIYCSTIRPIVEYAARMWNGSLTQEQSDSVEHIQERAMKIAYHNSHMQKPYSLQVSLFCVIKENPSVKTFI